MRFILFVEGYTEDKALPEFLKRWLDPRLTNPVAIRTVRFEGWAELAWIPTQTAPPNARPAPHPLEACFSSAVH